jgi:S1-C subfamily serine protease
VNGISSRLRLSHFLAILTALVASLLLVGLTIFVAAPRQPADWRADGTPGESKHREKEPTTLSPEAIFKRASPGVVLLVTYTSTGKSLRQGSGFLVSGDGLIATNHHVIKDAPFAEAIFSDGAARPLSPRRAACDPKADLALLKVDVTNPAFLELAEDELPSIGSKVFAIGSPLGESNSFSDGLVSGHRVEESSKDRLIQTTAPSSPGSSGGPLLRADGKVVGIVSGGLPGAQNVNYAIPVEALKRLLRERASMVRGPSQAQPTRPRPAKSRQNFSEMRRLAGELLNPGIDRGIVVLGTVEHRMVILTPVDGLIVRRAFPPVLIDNKGQPRTLTAEELREFKGDDDLPGFVADVSELKKHQFVTCYITPPKEGSPDSLPEVQMIVIDIP